MDESELKAIASQLSCPQGDEGIEMGNKMNEINLFMTQRTIEALAPQTNEVIAEFGPGNGALSETLVEALGLGGKYYGIELSEVMAKEARERLSNFSSTVEIICSDCMTVELPEAGLDAVMAINFLYFLDNLDAYFNRLSQWLKPGARAAFGVRSEHALSNLPFVQYGFNVRTVDDIKETMLRNGFSAVDSKHYDEGTIELGGLSLPVDSVVIKGII